MYETSEDELRKTMVKTNNVVAEILKKKPCLASECQNGDLENIDTGLPQKLWNQSLVLLIVWWWHVKNDT